MLAINREHSFKNKLFLSGVALASGFILTVGIIRVINPTDTTTNQSTQTSSDRRASSLIPINSSDSESASESDKNKAGANAATAAGSEQPASTSPWQDASPNQ